MSLSRTLPQNAARFEPQYVQGTRPGECWAHFPSGAIVHAERGRVRRYPCLDGPAPVTSVFYWQSIDFPDTPGMVLDVGCGSGTGTRILREVFSRVLGIDRDRFALAFARQYEPRAEYLLGDASRDLGLRPASAAVVIDVLGQVPSPRDVLVSLRRQLAPNAWLFVAEPSAHVAQQLACPVLRAFSRRELSSLLTRAGFHILSAQDNKGFVTIHAEPSEGNEWQRLDEVAELVQRGDPQSARRVLASLCDCASPDLAFEAKLMECVTRMASGKIEAASRLLETLAVDRPNDARPHVALAHIALNRGQREQALCAARAARSADPGDASATRAYALVAEALQQDDAASAWQSYRNLCPDSEKATRGAAEPLVRVNTSSGNWRTATQVPGSASGRRSC